MCWLIPSLLVLGLVVFLTNEPKEEWVFKDYKLVSNTTEWPLLGALCQRKLQMEWLCAYGDAEVVYCSCWNESIKVPLFTVHKPDLRYGGKRPEVNSWDSRQTLKENNPKDGNGSPFTTYKGGIRYDRGHLVPNGDLYKNNRPSFNAINRVPQYAEFNRNHWKCAEISVRKLLQKKGNDVLVITGILVDPFIGDLLEQIEREPTIPQKCRIPSKIWKIVVIDKQMFYFAIPNFPFNGSGDHFWTYEPEAQSVAAQVAYVLQKEQQIESNPDVFDEWLGGLFERETMKCVLGGNVHSKRKPSGPKMFT